MNPEKYLILLKGEDKTEQINYCEYLNGKWRVIYNNSTKEYNYSFTNVGRYTCQRIISHETNIIYHSNQPLSGIIKIIDFGDYIRLIFKTGYMKVYHRSSIVIDETCLSNEVANSCFEYLKQIAEHVSIKGEDDISFLSKQYRRIKTISPRSVLSVFLEGKSLGKTNNQVQPIFPFGFNISQKMATEKALTQQISLIEGPPGTGKTQTILNIIANAIIYDKTVAVVSNNNSATANVLEKLQKYGVDFIAAYLGNSNNKEKFFAEQRNTYPSMKDWALSYSDFQKIKNELITAQQKLNQMLEYKNIQAKLRQRLSILQIEYEYFNGYNSESMGQPLKLRSFTRLSADKIILLMIDYIKKVEKGDLTLHQKLRIFFIFGIYSLKLFNNTPEEIISYLQKTYYNQYIKELKSRIEELSRKLDNYNFDEEIKNYSDQSMKLFKAKLAEKFNSSESRRVFSDDAIWKSFDSFIKEYPVILSTTHSLRSCICENYLFDFVIIDESSQVDLATGALALSCAKNAVIVGDVKQLPNVVTDEVAKVTKEVFSLCNLHNAYSYAENSLLSSMAKLYKDIPQTLLKEHYRCHPKIIGFCNQKYYNNQLIILTEECENDKPLVAYKTIEGNHARGNLNQRQIDVIFEEIIPNQNLDDQTQSIGIISPFRLQTNEIKKTIENRNIEADTVHKFQGREKDVVILSTVANEINVDDFADNPNLVNVAVSRAIDKLIVVVSDRVDSWIGTNIGDLVRYIQYNNFEIIESQIYSVFDLLYSHYSEKLLEIKKNRKKASEYESENLTNAVIEKVLKQPEFQTLGHVLHQPLKMLIKDPSMLTDEECRYAMNILTHTDFVIFNKLDKIPVLVVEVDGYAYHADNPKQLKRDDLKNEILKKYSIPILRLKTNESNEELRLHNKLNEILKL